MKKLLFLLLIVCLALMLFSCAKQNDFSSTDTQNGTCADTSVSSDTGSSNTNTDTSTEADVNDSSITPKSNDGKEGEQSMEGFVLKGIVIAINDKLEIEVIESDYAFGVYHVIVPNNIPITDANGNAITLADLVADDVVLISYNGQTMLSYPPQIVAHKIILQ